MAAVLLAASACTSSPAARNGGDAPDRLTVAVAQDYGPLNILNQSEDELTFLVYDRLVAPSPYVAAPQPWLAKEVRKVDPSTWVVPLRDDVSWHDGEPFTAADVAFTIRWFKRVPSGTYTHHVTTVPEIARVEVLGRHKVRLTCGYPCPFLGSVTLAHLPILPEHIWRGVEQPTKRTALPVGTGPYRLVSYDPSSGYRFVANRDYFAGAPVVDELVMPIIEDPSTTFTALRTGEIDAAARPVPPELLGEFRRSEPIDVATTTPLRFPELRMNYEHPPFDRAAFRRALSFAVDRRELLRTVWLGQGRPAVRGYPHPSSPWTDPELRTQYDPDSARRILDQLGFTDRNGDGIRATGDGKRLAFTIKVAGTEPTHIRAAQLLADQFGAVGIEIAVRRLDPGTLGDLFDSRNFDLYINQISAHGVADPTQFIMSHFSGYLWDLPEVPYPEFAALVEKWKAATTIEARTELLFAMQQLFNSQPTAIPLIYPAGNIAFRPAAYDGWVESPGYGLVHKWSLLPPEVARNAHAVVERRAATARGGHPRVPVRAKWSAGDQHAARPASKGASKGASATENTETTG